MAVSGQFGHSVISDCSTITEDLFTYKWKYQLLYSTFSLTSHDPTSPLKYNTVGDIEHYISREPMEDGKQSEGEVQPERPGNRWTGQRHTSYLLRLHMFSGRPCCSFLSFPESYHLLTMFKHWDKMRLRAHFLVALIFFFCASTWAGKRKRPL